MRIAVGTTSELKLRAVSAALSRAGFIVQIQGYVVLSDVPKQPFSREEIFSGAKNRAVGAGFEDKHADYSIGIESGIFSEGNVFFEAAACVIVDRHGQVVGQSMSAAIETPKSIVERIKSEDSEAGAVVSSITGNTEKDPIVYYTGGKFTRSDLLEDAVFLALARQLLNPEAYK